MYFRFECGYSHEQATLCPKKPILNKAGWLHPAGTARRDGDHRPAGKLGRPEIFCPDWQVRSQDCAGTDRCAGKGAGPISNRRGAIPQDGRGSGGTDDCAADKPEMAGPVSQEKCAARSLGQSLSIQVSRAAWRVRPFLAGQGWPTRRRW